MLINGLQIARRTSGLSQRALGERIGVGAQTIKRLEQGVGTVPTLVAAMTALDYHLTGLAPGKPLAEQLRICRQKQSMSLKIAAARSQLARGTVASLERGGGSVASLMKLLAAIAPNVRRRAQERVYWGQSAKKDRDSRFTPLAFMEKIYVAFGEVDLDPCADLLSPVIAKRRVLPSEGGNGLVDEWSGRLAFVNPPFSELLLWLRRAHGQWQSGNVTTVVCLIPVRTDSAWFHDVMSFDADMFLLQGRIAFLDSLGRSQNTPFGLMLLALGATDQQKARFTELAKGYWMARHQSDPLP